MNDMGKNENLTRRRILDPIKPYLRSKKPSILHKILNFFKIILIFIYPFIWIFKEIKGFISLLKDQKSSNQKPLNYSQMNLIGSLPFFLILSGIAFSFLVLTCVYGNINQVLQTFLSVISNGFFGIDKIILGFIEILVFFGNFFVHSIFGFLSSDLNFIVTILVTIAFTVGLGYLFFTESGLIQRIFYSIEGILWRIKDIPSRIHEFLDYFWIKSLHVAGKWIFGTSVNLKSKLFFQRLIGLTFFYNSIIFIWGFSLFLRNLQDPITKTYIDLNAPENVSQVIGSFLFLFYYNLLLALLAGLLLFRLARILLETFFGRKYNIDSTFIQSSRQNEIISFLSKETTHVLIKQVYLCYLFNIPFNELERYLEAPKLGGWSIFSSYIVNKNLYDTYIARAEKLHQRAIEKKKPLPLFKGLEYLKYLEKKYGKIESLLNNIMTIEKKMLLDLEEIRSE